MSKLADYDKYNYDYSTYWKSRQYENNSEINVLTKLLSNAQGERFIDIGGSFGRLLNTYKDKYRSKYIIDYSLKTLIKNRRRVLDKDPDTILIAANAYKLPFKPNTFDGGAMVRVLHHIDQQDKYFKELRRVLSSDSNFIQEFANKIHIKARIRALVKNDKTTFNVKPYQQPTMGSNEGSKGEEVPFLNYHPKYIIEKLKKADFVINSKQSCSFLRSTPLATKLPPSYSRKIEVALQSLLKNSELTPSIFLNISPLGKGQIIESDDDIYQCPNCTHAITLEGEEITCVKCKKIYQKKHNIWDLREI